jgi:uncharacterized membrane protein YjjP (DUF1212 family)
MAPSDTEVPARDMQAFVLELGRALALAGTAVSETQERLTAVAAASGIPDARVVVLPTALIISLGPAGLASIESIPQFGGGLRLDQISALYDLVGEAERGDVEPESGLSRLRDIRAMEPRHGPATTVAAYGAMTVGLCLVLQPTPSDVLLSAVLGLVIGLLAQQAHGRPRLFVLAPVLAATVASACSFEALKHGIGDPGLRTLIAPLVIFLPGSALTTGTVELASGEMVAGASRLVFGSVQLLLLAFGIVAGAELAGLPSEAVLKDVPVNTLGSWAPWLGVTVFGLAASVHFSAPRRAVPWLMLVLLSAWVGQLLGDQLVSGDVSGFFGALVMTPIAMAVARLPGGPPSQVTFLPAFWLLVPGALGLIGVTQVVGNPAAATLGDLVRPIGSIVSIALGVLGGVSLYRGVGAARPFRRLASRDVD